MKNLAWLSGSVCDLSEAKVSVEDRGYLFGDGVYEVIRIYNATPFYLSAHLQRLQRSASAIEISIPHNMEAIKENINMLIAESGCVEGYIYMQVTRGRARRDHLFPEKPAPAMVMYVGELAAPPPVESINPAGCITLPDERWLNCYIKSVNLLPNILARQKAAEAGAVEAVLYRGDGTVTEGTRSNVFAVLDGRVYTHPESKLILSGITRSIVLEILNEQAVPLLEKAFYVEDLNKASEVWITSTTMEVKPIGSIDGRVLTAAPGPVCRRLIEGFRKKIEAACY